MLSISGIPHLQSKQMTTHVTHVVYDTAHVTVGSWPELSQLSNNEAHCTFVSMIASTACCANSTALLVVSQLLSPQ